MVPCHGIQLHFIITTSYKRISRTNLHFPLLNIKVHEKEISNIFVIVIITENICPYISLMFNGALRYNILWNWRFDTFRKMHLTMPSAKCQHFVSALLYVQSSALLMRKWLSRTFFIMSMKMALLCFHGPHCDACSCELGHTRASIQSVIKSIKSSQWSTTKGHRSQTRNMPGLSISPLSHPNWIVRDSITTDLSHWNPYTLGDPYDYGVVPEVIPVLMFQSICDCPQIWGWGYK